MKPYPLRIGMGERLLGLLKTYGNFPLYTEGVQGTDQVRVELLKDWDQEQVSNLRATDIEETKIQQPFKIADWLVVTARALACGVAGIRSEPHLRGVSRVEHAQPPLERFPALADCGLGAMCMERNDPAQRSANPGAGRRRAAQRGDACGLCAR